MRLGSRLGARDRRLLLWLAGAVLLLAVLTGLLAPATAGNDPRPSTYNAAPGGTEAAFLTLRALHQPVARWDRPLEELTSVDAAHATLVLLSPRYTSLDQNRLKAAVGTFLSHGGRLITTGNTGALLLGGAETLPGRRFGMLCYTEPEGPGALAAAGSVEMQEGVRWARTTPDVRVEQRCGADAVVVRVPVGRGEAIWWSTPAPITNAELLHEADLRLVLASLGTGRTVLFDESLQGAVRSSWSAVRGLPLGALLAQVVVLFGLVIFSFSRRHGPVRLPVALPRASPLEFVENMGDLYERGGATEAALGAARRRFARVVVREGGLGEGTVALGPAAVVTALEGRFGGGWAEVGEHLRAAEEAAATASRPAMTLEVVRALGEDAKRLQTAARAGTARLRETK